MQKVLFTGQGGQGVLSMGLMLSESAMHAGKNVTFLPSYGVEMRGGPASCGVTITDGELASPLCTSPDILVCMSERALLEHKHQVKQGGMILVNSSIVQNIPEEKNIYKVPANDLAIQAGNVKASNMVMLGFLVALTAIVEESAIYMSLKEKFSKKEKVRAVNEQAFLLGKSLCLNLQSKA